MDSQNCVLDPASVPADCSEAGSRLFHGQVKDSPIQNGLSIHSKVHKGSQPRGETRLKALQSPPGSRVQTSIQTSPRIYEAQITTNWGSQWAFWGPLRSAYARVKSQHPVHQFGAPVRHLSLSLPPPPTTSVLQADRNRTRETEEEDLATRVTLTTSQNHPSLSFPRPNVHAVSEAAGQPLKRETP